MVRNVCSLLLLLLARDPAAASPEPRRPLVLVVHSDDSAFGWRQVRQLLEPQLGAAIVERDGARTARGTVTVTWRPSRGELAVTYEEAGRGTVSRVVAAPEQIDQAVATAVDLAVNLVRDEADDLLGPRPSPPPPSAPMVVAAPAAPPAAAPSSVAAVAFFYPLASNAHTPELKVRFALGVFYSRVGAVDGLQLGLGVNRVDGPVSGAQLALGFNLATSTVSGFQISTFINHARGEVSGMQAALGYNGSAGVRGLQLGFGVNRTAGLVEGVQAGMLNLAGDVDGLQFGLVNVGHKVRGVQLGLVNIAEDVTGIPIGIISVTESGGVHPVVWGSTEAQANVGIKFSTRYTYTLFHGSARREDARALYGPGLALGARIPFLPGYFESDLGASYLFGGPLCCLSQRRGIADDLLFARLRVLVGAQLYRHLSLFAGAALTVRVRFDQPPPDKAEAALGPELFGGVQL
jgi:hypothetical protein